MPEFLLPTTVIGSYPQPDWLVDKAVLKSQTVPRVRLREMWRVPEEFLEQAQDDATVIAMVRLGADRARIRAALGPCIAQKSYEVGAEFRANFIAADAANAAFFIDSARAGHFMFDLPAYVLGRIARAGLAHIGHVALDTCTEETRLFSYRRTTLRGEADFGRGLSAIALVPE